VIGDFEMPKINGKFCKPPSTACWNLDHACPRPESDFCLTPPSKNSATAVECGGDGGSALASRLSESEHIIGMRNYKIQNGSALPQRHRPSLETL